MEEDMILSLNCGSQSIKWKIFKINKNKLNPVADNNIRIANKNHFKKSLIGELKNIFKEYKNIKAVGHRVVHGGGKLSNSKIINKAVVKEIKRYSDLAPLHNFYNYLGIKEAQKIFSKIKHIAVFDTGFFKDLPEKVYTYAIPQSISKKFNFRRFGFHGISHRYLTKRAAELLKKPVSKVNLITCHLGGGSSITLIKNGKAIDTSMGFTPLEGLVMMTRCGDIDPGIVIKLSKKYKNLEEILNKESGLKGICGCGDMLGVLSKVKKNNYKAKLALDLFCYHIQKYIGSYFVLLDRVDAIVFSGEIGFGSQKIRNMIIKDLKILKKTKILKIKTDEELMIAEEAMKLI